ncbi:flavodoxin-dependent (E)-4-hydroxy-3-methylbut-2-enyl-diphosphate synthase [Garciella nitratireducens]|uniref:4-hydroxy-3-methylbut-2-en-1-yl diphosphate synthase (flavodoxin) n=1 Tax=Garciella nitratireducens DSM 15102 TaxID=1121911 RepID=A0A1T4JX07_9FIRM|nr:flavodoxin-dependent (E)-4-hydroxy-3-methylbut-2-enyl-diphosphate synthase [Garciella nitratireducens]RBP41161.1 4-hydroxy-3-methylbut-2-en-1-yl diphosphate synthase [Garciella nitratireducens]SJZ34627.1 4-hydroxy-3-methylbut-2-en-1-yl diphosphate synthase [Garciella nitratireducens DSM 15102]
MKRKKTKKIRVKDMFIGGDAPISIQSMTKTDTRDINATINQIKELEEIGCDIVRVAIPNMEAAQAIKTIVQQTNIPIVADIHFDYRLALEVIKNGIHKLRINPGNIGDFDRIEKVVNAAKERNIPIRIGVNAGSINSKIIKKYGGISAQAMVDSAQEHIRILESLNFDQIIISLKSSNVVLTIEAYELMSKQSNYPLHIGITESGTKFSGTIKSSVGIGSLLSKGIGDTIRVSLTDKPIEEIIVGKEILKSLNLRNDSNSIEIISCPTCGRCQIDLIDIAKKLEKNRHIIKNQRPLKIAVMGCAVNGPGEAREADIGIAGGNGKALLFKKGKIIRPIDEGNILNELINEINKLS